MREFLDSKRIQYGRVPREISERDSIGGRIVIYWRRRRQSWLCPCGEVNSVIIASLYLDPINGTRTARLGSTHAAGHPICSNPHLIFIRSERGKNTMGQSRICTQ
jgi:hypothetical protein